MDIPDLIKKLREIETLKTLVGDFSFIKQVGEGGNSNVCLYKKMKLNLLLNFFPKELIANRKQTDL